MSTDFTRNKSKRVRSTSSTEVNNSFVKTVTSRVSGLLPATISKWFGSPSSSPGNGTVAPNEATDSSTDDDVAESVTMNQPPMKKMRYSSNASTSSLNNNFELLESNNQPFEASKTTELCNTYSVIQSPPGKNTFRRETNFVSTPVKAAHDAPSPSDDRNEKDAIYFTPQLTVTQIGRSIEKKRKSLFNNNSSQASINSTKEECRKSPVNNLRESRQPSFKASLLGSPFYAGRTMYGGAASSLYVNHPNIKQTKVCVVAKSERCPDASAGMSHAARRVLDLLEHYASPLIEAKRIPVYNRPKNNLTSPDNGSNDSTITDQLSKIKSYKTQELHVPSIASFLRVKQRSRLMHSTTAARQIIASQSSTSDFLPYPALTQKNSEPERHSLKTKVTSRLTRTRRGDAGEMNMEVAAPVELPTAVLKINKDELPKFSFAATIVTNSASVLPKIGTSTGPKISETLPNHIDAQSNPKLIVDKATEDDTQTNVNESSTFKFSSPIRITNEQHQLNAISSNFVFGSPDRSVDKVKSVASVVGGLAETGKTTLTLTTTPTTNKSKDWKCDDCWVNNKPEADKCACCGGKKPAQGSATSIKCSLCKIANVQAHAVNCVDCEKGKSKMTTAIKLPVTAPANQWTCPDCWVKNDDSIEKCVCCGRQHAKANADTTATTPTSSGKPWRCADCWVDNKSHAEKCAACGGPPPASTPAPAPTPTPTPTITPTPTPTPKPTPTPAPFALKLKPTSDLLLTNIVKSQSEKWECSSCLVKNESNALKCVCCETPKPGSGTETHKKFNFGASNTSFKFGIPPANQNSSVITDNSKLTIGEKANLESEKNNNNLPSTPNLTFGIPTTKTDSITLPTNASSPIASFKFGLPGDQASSEKPLVGGFKFNTPAKDAAKSTASVGKEEPEQQVPGAKQASTGADFKYFASSSDTLNTKPIGENPLLSGITSLKKQQADGTIIENSTPSDVPKNNFTFSPGSGVKNALTGAPTLSYSTSISLTPVKAAAGAASSPLSTTTLFTKSDPPNTTDTSPPTTTTSSALFNFGSNLASEPKLETKAKINFSFGGPKSDAPQAFSFNAPAASALPPANILSNASSPANGNVDNTPKSSMFGSVQKENVWPTPVLNNNSANMFATSTPATNNLQKPAAFSFGASTSFSSGNVNLTPAFGNSSANNTMQAFGSSATTTPNFGNNQQGASAVPGFGSNQQAPPFGTSQQSTGIIPSFGSNQSAGLTPAFGQQTSGLASTFSTNQQGSISASPFGNSQQNAMASSTFGAGQQSPSSGFGGMQQGAGSAPAFGTGVQAGVNSKPPMFGGSTTPNMFGMSSSNGSSQPSLFSNPAQNQAGPFGGGQGGQGAPGAGMAMFGAGGATTPQFGNAPAPTPAAPSFGTPNASMPAFEAPAMAPAFNFGAPQNNAMFGFRQQQPAGVYNFGSAPGTSPQVQFNMGISTGSTPATQSLANRKIRKAARRTTQR